MQDRVSYALIYEPSAFGPDGEQAGFEPLDNEEGVYFAMPTEDWTNLGRPESIVVSVRRDEDDEDSDDGIDYAAEADYRAHSSSHTGIYEGP